VARKWSFLIGCLALSLLLVACPLSLASAGIDYGDIDGEWASNLLEKLESAIQESEGQAVDFSEIDLMLQTSTLYHECYDREPGGDGDAHMALGYLTNWRRPVVATGEATLGPSIEPACYG
jgi:hypothetical protein